MSIQINNTDELYLAVVRDGISVPVLKSTVSMDVNGTVCDFYYVQKKNPSNSCHFPLEYTDVSSPVVISASDLFDQITDMLISGFGAGGSTETEEIPTGAINGINLVYTTSVPYVTGSIKVHRNGIKLIVSVGFTETSDTTITMDASQILQGGADPDTIQVTFIPQ